MNRTLVSVLIPWMISGMLGILILLFASQIRTLIRSFFALPIQAAILFCIILLSGIYIRFSWVPNTHRIYFDEDRYLMYAVSFAKTGKALGIQIATPTTVLAGDPDPGVRMTVPVIHAWAFRLFGYHDSTLFMTEKILSVLQIPLLFLTSYFLYGSLTAALFSAAAVAWLPITVYWSTTTNLDSLFLFFGSLSLFSILWFLKSPSIKTALYTACSTSLLLFVRIEGMLLVLVMAAAYILLGHTKKRVLSTPHVLLAAILIPVLLLRIVVALPLISQTWCCAEATPLEIFQPGYFWRNTIPNITTLLFQIEFPAIITLLSLYAGIRLRSFSRQNSILAIWIFLYFMLYSFYYVGIFYSYTFSGSYGRFFLMLVPPFILLAGLSVAHWRYLFNRAPYERKTRLLLIALAAVLTLYPTVLSYRTLIKTSPWDRLVEEGPREMRAFLTEDLIPHTPSDAIIIHPLTAAIVMSGRTAVSIEAFLFQKQAITLVRDALAQNRQVFMLVTDVCDATAYKCTTIEPLFTFEPFDIPEQIHTRYRAYRVLLKKP